MNPQTWWYLARASGLVAWVLLVASLVMGILLATRALKPADRPAWLLAVHRSLSAGAICAVALHLAALVADSYVYFGWMEIFVPGSSGWKTSAVTVGVFAFYLLLAVQLTSLFMRRIPRRLWHWVHLTSYVMVWSVTVHAGMAGTDATNRVYQVVALALTIVAVAAAVLRILAGKHSPATRRPVTVPAPADQPVQATRTTRLPTLPPPSRSMSAQGARSSPSTTSSTARSEPVSTHSAS